MTNAVATATLTLQDQPAGTTVGAVVFTLLDSTGAAIATQSIPSAASDTDAAATFTNVAPGTYTVSVQRQDGSGTALGAAITSQSFTITAPTTVSVSIPTNVTIILS